MQSSVSLHRKLLGVPAAGLPAAALPTTTSQFTKSPQFGPMEPGAVAFSQARQTAEVMCPQSAPQSFLVKGGSQTSPGSTTPLPHSGPGPMNSMHVELQIAPAGAPGGKSVPSHGSPGESRPSPHSIG